MVKLKQAADLKVPAALAVDAVRYSISDAGARMRWARCVSAPLLAGAFAVAKEWENAALVSELIEYHSARGAFTTELGTIVPARLREHGLRSRLRQCLSRGSWRSWPRHHRCRRTAGSPAWGRYRRFGWTRPVIRSCAVIESWPGSGTAAR